MSFAMLLIAWLLPPYLLLLQRRQPLLREPRAPRRRQLLAILVQQALMVTLRIRDGKLFAGWESGDFLGLFEQLGLIHLAAQARPAL